MQALPVAVHNVMAARLVLMLGVAQLVLIPM
jgi:hypothetical protein